MSAYDGTGRLKSQGDRMHAPSAAARSRSKQRKWQVLLSIGLLLPALAAIIGIVAWAISVEVANSAAASNGLTSGSSRKLAQHYNSKSSSSSPAAAAAVQYHQFRRHLPQPYSEASEPQPQQQQARQPVHSVGAASRAGAPASTARRLAVATEVHSPAKSESGAGPQENRLSTATEEKTAASSAKSSAGSTLLLTNLEQVEALSGSGGSEASASASSAENDPSDQALSSHPSSSSPSVSSASQQDEEDEAAVKESDSENSDSSSSSSSTSSSSSDDGDESDRDATQDESESAGASATSNEAATSLGANGQKNKQQASAAGMMIMASPRNVNHKSRLMLSEQHKATSNKRPISLASKQRQQVVARKLQQQQNENSVAAAVGISNNKKQHSRLVGKSDAAPITIVAEGARPTNRYILVNKSSGGSDSGDENSIARAPAAAEVPAGNNEELNSNSNKANLNEREDEEVSFEAIASAISNTLTNANSGSSQQQQQSASRAAADGAVLSADQPRALLPGQSTEGDTGLLPAPTDDQQLVSSSADSTSTELTGGSIVSGPSAISMFQRRKHWPVRRRTAGEHVAEVIDHIVERRKQANVSGPQIVVVAPIEGSASMKARSLTKVSADSEDKRPTVATIASGASAAANKKASATNGTFGESTTKKTTAAATKKDSIARQAAEKKAPKSLRTSKPIRARLLGVSPSSSTSFDVSTSKSKDSAKPPISYSERVEVIEDDDSSAFLVKQSQQPTEIVKREKEQQKEQKASGLSSNATYAAQNERSLSAAESDEEPEQEARDAADKSMLLPELNGAIDDGQAAADEEDQESSIHISSHSSEPKIRWPRHEISAGQTLERYAPLPTGTGASDQRGNQLQAISPTSNNINEAKSQPKLYSAEQLIREHVLKSKLKPKTTQTSSEAQSDVPDQKIGQQQQDLSQSIMNVRSPNNVVLMASNQQQQSQPQPQQQSQQQLQQQHQQPAQQVKMVPVTIRPRPVAATTVQKDVRQQQQQQQASKELGGFAGPVDVGAFGSGAQPEQVPLFIHQRPMANAPLAPTASGKQPLEAYQAMESQQLPQQSMMNYQQQQAQAQLTGREQPQAFPYQHQQQQKLLPQPHLHHQQQHYQQQHHHQLQQPPTNAAATAVSAMQPSQSATLPVFADQVYNVPAHMAESVIQEIQRAPSQIGLVNGQPSFISKHGGPQVPHHNQQQQLRYQPQQLTQAASQTQQVYLVPPQQQQQIWNEMAAANMIARMAIQQQQQRQVGKHLFANRNSDEAAPISVSVKPSKGLVHSLAQMALRHSFSSLGQQQSSPIAEAETGAAATQPSAETSQSSSDLMQSAGSEPTANVAVAPSLSKNPAPGGRSMRSLHASPSAPVAELRTQVSDQEAQESYGQMPIYQMAGGGAGYGEGPHYYGGGGGQEGGYQSYQDKKSKGITFHFGGGPIGGGTQLITSPMGIFKHLMIPLLPNPRVNLNGKVVFGVVLEKSTAIGEPKKKYKFWGR